MKPEHKKIIVVFILIVGIVAIASVLTYKTGNVVISNSYNCRDSDGGYNVYQRGSITYSSLTSRSNTMSDSCISIRIPSGLGRTISQLKEVYCSGGSGTGNISSGGAASYSISNCPSRYRCNNGACIR